jgi:stage V sporulation protein B
MSGMIVSESARAAAARNSERIRSLTTRLIEYTMIYAVFASAVLIRFGRPLGHTLGGGELAGGLISAIAPVVPFIYMEIVLESMIKGMGQQSFSSLNYLAEYVIRIAAVLILVPRFGFVGIAVSYYASNIFGNISRFIKVIRTSGIQFRPFRMIISPVAYAFMTMALTELLFRLLSLSGDSAVKMVLFTIVWLAAYCGIILPMNILKPHRTDKSITIVESAQINMSKAL